MSKKGKKGRPTKLTPKLKEEIVNLLKMGNYIETTCATVGINKSTFYAWMKKGEESTRPNRYSKFYEEVKQAQARSEAREVNIINAHAEKNWKAAAWKLERRHHERWGKKNKKYCIDLLHKINI
ncbi:transposase [Methanobacterium sp. ACI-7]|uniref:transposase n=1 Tax=unclassified Methanobacterium TaxID=2627676 RepID=UPI0039C316D6